MLFAEMCVYQYVGITHFPTYFSQIKWTFPKLHQASLHFSAVTLYTQNVIFKTWKRSTRMYLFIQSMCVNVFEILYYSDLHSACLVMFLYKYRASHMDDICKFVHCLLFQSWKNSSSVFFLPYRAAFMMERLTSNLKEAISLVDCIVKVN